MAPDVRYEDFGCRLYDFASPRESVLKAWDLGVKVLGSRCCNFVRCVRGTPLVWNFGAEGLGCMVEGSRLRVEG